MSPASAASPPSHVETSQQLARIDDLHNKVKIQLRHAQDLLQKHHRGELQAQMAVQLQQERFQQEELKRQRLQESGSLDRQGPLCQCKCPHHPLPAPIDHSASETSCTPNQASLNMPAKVDEREVRDLEKRVRGLEGRVRGSEGLPPDREMALLEVERLRRELEGLAKRREGLFGAQAREVKKNVMEAGKRVFGDDTMAKALARDQTLAKTFGSKDLGSVGKVATGNGQSVFSKDNESTKRTPRQD